jgi:hypothetical protein
MVDIRRDGKGRPLSYSGRSIGRLKALTNVEIDRDNVRSKPKRSDVLL